LAPSGTRPPPGDVEAVVLGGSIAAPGDLVAAE